MSLQCEVTGIFQMTGLRLSLRAMQSAFEQKLSRVQASAFRDQVARFAKRTLQTAIELTPARDLALIQENQRKQYANRVGYIPSVHSLEDPTLIVKDGVHWLYCNSRWWPASYRNLPDEIDGIYHELLSEHERRMQTSEGDFIAMRAQARMLYKKSWWQVGQSLSINVTGAGQEIRNAHSRHNPPKAPPKAYGQWRGGKYVISVVITNSFLEQESRYKPFSGKDILTKATEINRVVFDRECAEKLGRLMA